MKAGIYMKKIIIIVAVCFLLTGCNSLAKKSSNMDLNSDEYIASMKRDILCLMIAYPNYISDIEAGKDGRVYIVMKTGKRILYDDKKDKGLDSMVSNPDIQDMMKDIYPLYDINCLMPLNYDPGRVRVYPLLKEVYGENRSKVEANLVSVGTAYSRCIFNKNNDAAKSLKNALNEISMLSKDNGKIYRAAFPLNGTYNYRVISGTNRLSPHSFGIAIDLARDKRDYWKWASRSDGEARLASYPMEIVKVFEKNNFIWGGKWGHFDILHFEYRPELIIKSKYFSNKPTDKSRWYYGADENEEIKSIIKAIDEKLK